MARVTVEDCLEKVDNRFKLISLAAKRARHLAKSGEKALVPEENDKVTVLALREIAAGLIGMDFLDQPKKQQMVTDFAQIASNIGKKMSEEDIAEIELATTQVIVDEEQLGDSVQVSDELPDTVSEE